MPSKPTTTEEVALRRQGYEFIAGVDEVGRGAWAGPLVAAAVILPADFQRQQVNDSKKMTAKQRELMFIHISLHAVSWAVAIASPKEIDRRGISVVNTALLADAVRQLHVRPQAVLVDAFKISIGTKPVKAIVHGDAKVVSIAAASIVAKVVRDELMRQMSRRFPDYEFHRHKGYGTPRHRRLLKKYGPSPIHRMTWRPMNGILKKKVKMKNSLSQ